MRIERWLIYLIPALVWAQTGPSSTPVPDQAPVTVKLSWTYDALPKEMKVYELKTGAKMKLWDTEVVKSLGAAPLGKEIVDQTLQVSRGKNKRFVLVFRNTSKEVVHFFAAPHQMKPEGSALGFKFKCLCVNKVYDVQPGWIWYRVVELRVSPRARGNELEITHGLFGVSLEDAKEFEYKNHMDMDHEM